jgi:hypothetical protein
MDIRKLFLELYPEDDEIKDVVHRAKTVPSYSMDLYDAVYSYIDDLESFEIYKHLKTLEGKKVIGEVLGGSAQTSGYLSITLTDKEFTYYSLDIASYFVKLKGIKYLRKDVVSGTPMPQYFDVLFEEHNKSLSCLQTKEEVRKFFTFCSHSLKEKGTLIIAASLEEDFQHKWYMDFEEYWEDEETLIKAWQITEEEEGFSRLYTLAAYEVKGVITKAFICDKPIKIKLWTIETLLELGKHLFKCVEVTEEDVLIFRK